MRRYVKIVLPVASLFIGLATVNQLSPIPQIRPAFADAITIGTAAGSGGDHLVDGQGRSLYYFDQDPPGGSTCTDDCARVWPPLTASESDTVGVSGSAQANRLGVPYVRLDGSRQVVYADRPLYRYTGDTNAGDTKGNNLSSFGGRWCLVSPSGAPLCQSGGSAPSGTPTPTSTATLTPFPPTTPTGGPTTPPNGNPPNGNPPGSPPDNNPPGNPPDNNPPGCGTCTCTLPGQVNCLNACGQSFPC